ncbi:acireductone synthase [Leptothoe spongobia]|uniref:Enolase-phosphatase E1 n=1 Tax=Leptothoe spongobia TAU-MAC 1115 TaxID=1967444 RepID=A0A947GM77_9CYAN|nr:acireductone synthase [Leptothoe spongobia]MBT9317502.1 acireductone synthase [Leptothoe spongobia TAU-MAC 1115]
MIKVILLDIEGTTTPIDFVTKTLFPYARSRYSSFLEENFASSAIREIIERLWLNYGSEAPALSCWSEQDDMSGAAAYLTYLTDHDRKLTALKDLQGKIWRTGYENNSLKGEMYDDVLPALQQWQAQKLTIAIYSSGSIAAQQLIFGYSNVGDLRPYISDYFDTTTGAKIDSSSYQKIAKHLKVTPQEIHFYSDNPKEIQAAQAAGCIVTEIRREKNHILP